MSSKKSHAWVEHRTIYDTVHLYVNLKYGNNSIFENKFDVIEKLCIVLNYNLLLLMKF